MEIIIRVLPIICGIFAYKKYRFSEFTFFIMFLVSVCGQGFFYNNIFRYGPIFPSDLYLMIFVIMYMLNNKFVLKVNVKTFTILFSIVLFQFFLGIVSNNDIGEILTDFKYVLYFFVPYFYGKNIYYDYEQSKDCFLTYVFCVVISLALNWRMFFTNGLQYINNGQSGILRTFGIGMGFGCGVLGVCLLLNYKENFVKRYGKLLYYISHFILTLSVIVSYTRTVWIAYTLTVLFNCIFILSRKTFLKRKMPNMVIGLVILTLFVYLFYNSVLKKSFPDVVNAIVERLFTISETAIDTENTFWSRIDSIKSGIDVFFSPRIIWGYGYGALYKNKFGMYYNRLENSYIYYLWKYGLIVGIYLFYRVYRKIKEEWCSGSMAQKTMVIYFVIFVGISAWSGNMNSTYSLAAYSIILSINYGLLFDVSARC